MNVHLSGDKTTFLYRKRMTSHPRNHTRRSEATCKGHGNEMAAMSVSISAAAITSDTLLYVNKNRKKEMMRRTLASKRDSEQVKNRNNVIRRENYGR
jgi:hypothetical protein